MTDTPTQAVDEIEYETDYEIGQDNVTVLGLDVHNPVFFLAASFVLIFSGLTLIWPVAAGQVLSSARSFTLQSFDWFFAVTPVFVFGFCLLLALSPLGRIKLGGKSATPDFSRRSWVAMLFASGVGVGFMFWGAAEPLGYFTDWFGTPLNVDAESDSARRLAFSATLFHWGLAPWAIYAVVGLALGYFAHNKGLPLSIRSAFYPLLGERVWGWPGHIIDLFAVVSTIFGLATTIGLGATQAASGLGYVFGFESGLAVQIALIVAMTSLALVSVLRGMDGGVKLLSNINMMVAFLLLVFVVIVGPTLLIVTGFGRHLLSYALDTLALTNWVGREDIVWFHDWTIFYWAWWISWSPFVGMFIARISRGRTVREYLSVVLLAPFSICVVWFSAFGETAISVYQDKSSELSNGITNSSVVLFQVLAELPLAEVTTLVAIALLIVFIVTSADSGALVVDTITSGGKMDAPLSQRAFWACMLGLTAAALLTGGGTAALESLQAGTIAAALPFTLVLWLCCLSLWLGMRGEARDEQP